MCVIEKKEDKIDTLINKYVFLLPVFSPDHLALAVVCSLCLYCSSLTARNRAWHGEWECGNTPLKTWLCLVSLFLLCNVNVVTT